MVRTFANLPADSLGSFSYYHVLSRDAFSEPNPIRSRGSFHFEVHCTSPDKSDRSRTLQRKGPFRLTSAKGYLSEVQGFAQVLVHYCKSLPCLIQVGNALYPGYIACFLSSIKYRMVFSWPKFGERWFRLSIRRWGPTPRGGAWDFIQRLKWMNSMVSES